MADAPQDAGCDNDDILSHTTVDTTSLDVTALQDTSLLKRMILAMLPYKIPIYRLVSEFGYAFHFFQRERK